MYVDCDVFGDGMNGEALDVVLIAPLAPIFGLVLFWFIQLLFIEFQKGLLNRLRGSHDALVRFTNFIGIFFQTLCHALGYTLTRSGISSFYLSVDYGSVNPKKKKPGVFEWLVNMFLFIGPFFLPPFLLLAYFFLLTDTDLPLFIQETFTFAENMILFGSNLSQFSIDFVFFLGTIDLFHPAHAGFFILFIIIGLGIRPSYIGKKPIEKVDIFYDLKNIRYNILHKPLYVLLGLMVAYVFFYVNVLFGQSLYVAVFSFFAWASIVAIFALVYAEVLLFWIIVLDDIPMLYRVFNVLMLPFTYILLRIVFYLFSWPYAAQISFWVTIICTGIITIILLHRSTNKFKTLLSMNSIRGMSGGKK